MQSVLEVVLCFTSGGYIRNAECKKKKMKWYVTVCMVVSIIVIQMENKPSTNKALYSIHNTTATDFNQKPLPTYT